MTQGEQPARRDGLPELLAAYKGMPAEKIAAELARLLFTHEESVRAWATVYYEHLPKMFPSASPDVILDESREIDAFLRRLEALMQTAVEAGYDPEAED